MSPIFQAIGGTAGCRKLSQAFYARVGRDPVLRPLFPGKTLRCAIEEFAAFLVQFLGGPGEDSQFRWQVSLRESHRRFSVGPKERDAWMKNMVLALDDVELESPVRNALRGFFEKASAYVIDLPEDQKLEPELAERWDGQRKLDAAVAAIRCGDAVRAIELAAPANSGLYALMLRSGNPQMIAHVQDKLRQNPALIQQRYAGRTLLHEAAATGDLATTELLLSLGADPNVTTGGGHTPLYCVGNQCMWPTGAGVVRTLVRAGAKVDACDGVKHCTALHMAARRGNVAVAAALLDCGASIEARDTSGETPLRRAVNCKKPEVAALLLRRGADMHSKDKKGLTPVNAARGAMQQLFEATR